MAKTFATDVFNWNTPWRYFICLVLEQDEGALTRMDEPHQTSVTHSSSIIYDGIDGKFVFSRGKIGRPKFSP